MYGSFWRALTQFLSVQEHKFAFRIADLFVSNEHHLHQWLCFSFFFPKEDILEFWFFAKLWQSIQTFYKCDTQLDQVSQGCQAIVLCRRTLSHPCGFGMSFSCVVAEYSSSVWAAAT